MSKQVINQYYHFSIILYEYPTQDLLLLLGVKEYAFIEHQFDLDNKGDLKKIHYHLYIYLERKKTPSGIFNILNKWKENCTQSFLIENLDNPPKFIRYLTHIDNQEKYQYNVSDIVTNMDIEKYFNISITDSEFTKNVLELIERKEIKTFKELVYYSLTFGKIDLLMKRAYFFKCLL